MALKDHSDPLFLAITRPAMKMGVPFEGLVINGILSWWGYIIIGGAKIWTGTGLLSLLIFPALHLAMRYAVTKDPNCFRVIMLFAFTRGLQVRRNSILWPMPWWQVKNTKHMPAGAV
jgi:type IV secretion system protein VirB3